MGENRKGGMENREREELDLEKDLLFELLLAVGDLRVIF